MNPKDEDLDLLVLQYLRKKGFAQAEAALQAEAGIQNAPTMALAHQLQVDSGAITQRLLQEAAEKQPPERYMEEYERLAAWVDNSLDRFRPELQRVLYPLFVHVYFELIAKGASGAANGLVHKFRSRLVDLGARASKERNAEIQAMSAVMVPGHLDTNAFAKMVRANRQNIRLCEYSFELLMNFLQGARLWLLSGVVNARLKFDTYPGKPVALDAEGALEDDAGVLTAQADGQGVATNQTPLQLGLLKDNLEDRFSLSQLGDLTKDETKEAKEAKPAAPAAGAPDAAAGPSQPGAGDAAPSSAKKIKPPAAGAAGGAGGEEGAGPSAPKRKEAKKTAEGDAAAAPVPLTPAERAAAALRSKRQAVLQSRISPTMPLMPPSEKYEAEMLGELSNRVAANASQLPSCAFFTFVNTRQTFSSCTFSWDASRVAAGFSDSAVRIYDMKRMAAEQLSPELLEDMELDEEDLMTRTVTTLRGHSGPVNAVAYTPDEQHLVSASDDGTVRLWAPSLLSAGPACLAAYKGHMYPVWDAATCPSGYYFASASADRSARVWCLERIHCLRVCVGHSADVDVVRWHPNSHYLATGSSDRSVRLWDAHTGACVRYLGGQQAGITSLAFAPDGKSLVSGGDDGSILVWDLGTGKKLAALSSHDKCPVWSLAYSQGDGAVLASGGADHCLKLWSMPPGDASLVAMDGARHKEEAAKPYSLLKTYCTKATPIAALSFTPRNLLLGAGAFTVPSKKPRLA